MTPDEAATLQIIGKSLRKTFAAIIFKTFWFPLYALCVVKALSILRRKAKTPALLINLTIIVILFLIALILFVLDVINFVAEITTTFIHNPELPLAEKYASANASSFHLNTVTNALYAYMTILGDAIIVWRVYAFWGHGKWRWVLLILGAMLLGSVVTDVLLTYCVARLGTDIFDGAFIHPAFCRNIQNASYAMPAATTFVATTLIGISAWEYRRSIKPDLQRMSRKTRVEKIMLLLVESGFIYFLFFLEQVIGNIPAVSSQIFAREELGFADIIFQYSSSIVVGWYPTLVVILAHSQYTVIDTSVLSTVSTMRATAPEIYVSRSRLQSSNATKEQQFDSLPRSKLGLGEGSHDE